MLESIARRLPRWVLPDDLTVLGVVSAGGILAAYALSNETSAWLWVASALLVVHWLGDSLDGTLARVRAIQRPRYGYYLDHLVDALATALIGLGLGLSPYMLLSVGALIVVGYLILSINVYLESSALGRFSIGYGRLGPTELRLVVIALNTALALGLDTSFDLAGVGLTALDAVGVAVAGRCWPWWPAAHAGTSSELARAEPAVQRGVSRAACLEAGRELLERGPQVGHGPPHERQHRAGVLLAHVKLGAAARLAGQGVGAHALEEPERHAAGPDHVPGRAHLGDLHLEGPARIGLGIELDRLAGGDRALHALEARVPVGEPGGVGEDGPHGLRRGIDQG